MEIHSNITPDYDLWDQPWIGLLHSDGSVERAGIEKTLLQAHQYTGLYATSPLEIVGVHRLLTAILQDAISPQSQKELKALWRGGKFPEEPIQEFGSRYKNRFNLFSAKEPFFQSADIPSEKVTKDLKTVGYLSPDIPSATGITHFRHGMDSDQVFCPRCATLGLVIIPAFATSGGSGIKPSINGVPPIYIIPGGNNLFETLAYSVLLPGYQPEIRDTTCDLAWWKREGIIPRGSEVLQVGYLHSLTFIARRVRLYPEVVDCVCSRCGEHTTWGVRSMVFEMGESRPKDSAFWFDPFAAYHVKEEKPPSPIRPHEGHASWREFSSLFLQHKQGRLRPTVLDQLSNITEGETSTQLFRCIGIRTDMKAKVFEWIDTGYDVPLPLLSAPEIGFRMDEAIDFSAQCSNIISVVFREEFGGGHKIERYTHERKFMQDRFWERMGVFFRQLVLDLARNLELVQDLEGTLKGWKKTSVEQAEAAFVQTVEEMDDQGATLARRYRGQQHCHYRLLKHYEKSKKGVQD